MTRRPRLLLLVVVAALVAGVVGFSVARLVDTDAPDAVSTAAALEQLETDTAGDPPTDTDEAADTTTESETTPTTAAAEPASISAAATWTVDDEFGDFGFDNASGSFAGFRVEKAFFTGGGATAVGRSGDVTGEIVIGEGELASVSIVVDMTVMESDDSGRVGAIKDAVRADDFPTATFVVSDPISLDTAALERGETVEVEITGELTIAGTTQPTPVSLEATIVEPGLGLIVGTAGITWADFGVDTPESRVATVADEGVLEFQLVVRS